MFIAKFEYEDKDTIDYIYLDKKDNLVGFSLDKDGIKSVNKDMINEFVNMIQFNDSCVEILDDTEGYSVYYNPITKFKHYFKDGKEDFLMFLKTNGEDALIYEMNDEVIEHENKKNNKALKIISSLAVAGAVITTSVFGLSTFLKKYEHLVDYLAYKYTSEDVDIFNEQGGIAYEDPIADAKLDGSGITVDGAIELINDSINLIPEDKKFLSNEELLSDILPYYQGTAMAEDIKIRLTNIAVEYYEREDGSGIIGYYSSLEPSVVNVIDEYEEYRNNYESLDNYTYGEARTGIMSHEFLHLLQYGKDYRYLSETTAELMSEEYFNHELASGYDEGVKSLKLLIDIIGPEPILKGIFGGDFSDFNSIIADNLEYDDYDKLIGYLHETPSEIVDKESDIRRILCNLYQNIYGQDIRNDQNILYTLSYESENTIFSGNSSNEKYYLNKSKMQEKNVVWVNVSKLMEAMPENDYLELGTLYYVARNVVSYEEYSKYYKGTEFESRLSYNMANNVVKSEDGEHYDIYAIGEYDEETGKVINLSGKVKTLSFDEAFSQGYISAGVEVIKKDNVLNEGQEWCYDETGNVRTRQSYVSKSDGSSYFGYQSIDIEVDGIKGRFNVETDVDAATLAMDATTTSVDTSSVSARVVR